jgi:hypothetical protein
VRLQDNNRLSAPGAPLAAPRDSHSQSGPRAAVSLVGRAGEALDAGDVLRCADSTAPRWLRPGRSRTDGTWLSHGHLLGLLADAACAKPLTFLCLRLQPHDVATRAVFWWLNAGERWVMGWRSRASRGESGGGELGACRQTAASKKWRPTTHNPGPIPRGRRHPHWFLAKTNQFPGKNGPTMPACLLQISTAWAHPLPRCHSGAPPWTWRPHRNNSTMSSAPTAPNPAGALRLSRRAGAEVGDRCGGGGGRCGGAADFFDVRNMPVRYYGLIN